MEKGSLPHAPVHGAHVRGHNASFCSPSSRWGEKLSLWQDKTHLLNWKAERLKTDILSGLNPLYAMTSDRALDSNSNSVPPGLEMQPRDAQHPPSQPQGWVQYSGNGKLGAVLCYVTTVPSPAKCLNIKLEHIMLLPQESLDRVN